MSPSPKTETLTIPGPSGNLQCQVDIAANRQPIGAAIVCHPHPLHGGTMNNKVVHMLCRAANDLGYAAVRFNFRGVEESEGSYDDGYGEQDDARAVIAWARDRFPGPWLLAGFSFGSIVAIEVARHDPPAHLVSIAPPLGRLAAGDLPSCPWLIVQGDADELVDVDEVVRWVDEQPPGPELVVLEDVDHFFHGNLALLRKTIVDNLRGDAVPEPC